MDILTIELSSLKREYLRRINGEADRFQWRELQIVLGKEIDWDEYVAHRKTFKEEPSFAGLLKSIRNTINNTIEVSKIRKSKGQIWITNKGRVIKEINIQ